MRMNPRWLGIPVVVATASLLAPGFAMAQQEPVLAYYGISAASDRVFRGDDYYVRAFNKSGQAHSEFNNEPVVMPQLNLYGEPVELDIKGFFAAQDREDDLKNSHGAFYGLQREDEIDYSLIYHWHNRLGRFSGGIIYYSLLDEGSLGPGAITRPAQPRTGATEFMAIWRFPFWESVHPTFAQFSQPVAGQDYSAFSLSGELRRMTWDVNAGIVRVGPKDLTGSLSYFFTREISVSANASWRPEPKTLAFQDTTAGLSGYDEKGKYVPDLSKPTVTKSYPSTIYWLTLSWGERVH
jgi:hypothetical protein